LADLEDRRLCTECRRSSLFFFEEIQMRSNSAVFHDQVASANKPKGGDHG